MNELDELRARIVAQALQLTRVHTALNRIADSGGLSDPQVAMAREALDACEADAGQIAEDVRAVLAAPSAEGVGGSSERDRDARARLAAAFRASER